jgi:hypothetical protein
MKPKKKGGKLRCLLLHRRKIFFFIYEVFVKPKKRKRSNHYSRDHRAWGRREKKEEGKTMHNERKLNHEAISVRTPRFALSHTHVRSNQQPRYIYNVLHPPHTHTNTHKHTHTPSHIHTQTHAKRGVRNLNQSAKLNHEAISVRTPRFAHDFFRLPLQPQNKK